MPLTSFLLGVSTSMRFLRATAPSGIKGSRSWNQCNNPPQQKSS